MKHLLTLCILLFSRSIFSQTPGEPPKAAFLDSVEAQINLFMRKYHIVGSGVAVFQHDRVLLQKGYGFADLKNKVPAGENTVFRVASISKVFTATAVMQLEAAGKIDLKAPVEQYLPGLHFQYGPGMRKITIRDLLTHTSGLTDGINNGDCCDNPAEQQAIIELVNQEVLTLPPGLTMNYSNIGYGLLGCVIEQVSGQRYGDYLKQHVFAPLGMQHSSVSAPLPPAVERIKGYRKDSMEMNEPPLRDIAAGGVESSIADMTVFAQMILNQGAGPGGDIVSKETFRQMSRNQIGDIVLQTDEMFGYGLFITYLGTNADDTIGSGLLHGGDLFNHHAVLAVYPKLDLGMVILSNSEQGHTFVNVLANKIVKYFVKAEKGITLAGAKPAQFSTAALAADHIDHRLLRGVYGGGGADYLRIKKVNQKKLRFLQGKHVLVMKRNAQNLYTCKFLLLRFIPVKIKDLMFAFRQEDGRIFMKTLSAGSKDAEYISMKDPEHAPIAQWRKMEGRYEPVNAFYNNYAMAPVSLKCRRNKIIVYRKSSFSEDTDSVGFNPLDDQVAISDGLARGAGATLKILPNGNLYYSGFELKRVSGKK